MFRYLPAAVVLAGALLGACAAASPPIDRPLTLQAGTVEASSDLEVSLGTRTVLEPVSLAPGLRVGVTDRLTAGMVHSSRALGRVGAGHGLCLSGSDGGCARLYDQFAFEVLHAAWSSGGFEVAAHPRFQMASFRPGKPRLWLGPLARYRRGRLAAIANPHLALGLANRDRGNAHTLEVPAWLQVQIGQRAALQFHTGARGAIDGFTDKYQVAFGLGAIAAVSDSIDVGIQYGLSTILGPRNDFKPRFLSLWLIWRSPTGARTAGRPETAPWPRPPTASAAGARP